MLFEEYFVKIKGINSLEVYLIFSTVLEDIFHLIVVYKIFYTNG
jgi:hypothetical protein